MITSQLPVAKWHEYIYDPTLADAILDILTANAHRIELKGDCLRRKNKNLKGKSTIFISSKALAHINQ